MRQHQVRTTAAAVAAAALATLASLALRAAPAERRISIYAQTDGTFSVTEFWVDPREAVTVTFTNADGFFRLHNIVFELDAGRVVACDPVNLGNSQRLSFAAPAPLGDYPYYSSVGADRANGMTGTLHVGTPPSATPPPATAAPTTRTPTRTRTPTATRTLTVTPGPSTGTASVTTATSTVGTAPPGSATPTLRLVHLPLLVRRWVVVP